MSDRAAQIWEQQLPTMLKGRQLLAFEESVRAFSIHHFDFDESPSRIDRYKLTRKLGFTQIFESKVVESDNGDILLKGSNLKESGGHGHLMS